MSMRGTYLYTGLLENKSISGTRPFPIGVNKNDQKRYFPHKSDTFQAIPINPHNSDTFRTIPNFYCLQGIDNQAMSKMISTFLRSFFVAASKFLRSASLFLRSRFVHPSFILRYGFENFRRMCGEYTVSVLGVLE
jgi:hypothetical protein